MRIRSIIEMDNGVKYCASSSVEDTACEIKLNQHFIYLQVVCLVINENNIWNFKNILRMRNSGSITIKPIELNIDHIVSIRPTDIDLEETNE